MASRLVRGCWRLWQEAIVWRQVSTAMVLWCLLLERMLELMMATMNETKTSLTKKMIPLETMKQEKSLRAVRRASSAGPIAAVEELAESGEAVMAAIESSTVEVVFAQHGCLPRVQRAGSWWLLERRTSSPV